MSFRIKDNCYALNSININDLKKSFEYLVHKNFVVQGDVKEALRLEDYLKAVKIISKYVEMIDEFMKRTLIKAEEYKEKADDEKASICNKIVRMAEQIKTAHLEVEIDILIKYLKKNSKEG